MQWRLGWVCGRYHLGFGAVVGVVTVVGLADRTPCCSFPLGREGIGIKLLVDLRPCGVVVGRSTLPEICVIMQPGWVFKFLAVLYDMLLVQGYSPGLG